MLRQRALPQLFVIGSFLGACSVLNSFDDVRPEAASGGSNSAGGDDTGGKSSNGGASGAVSGGKGGVGTGGSAGTLGTGGAESGGSPEIGTAGSDLGGGGTGGILVGSGGSAGETVGSPETGLVILGGLEPSSGANVVVAIDPTTGEELSREALRGAAVAGIGYDGASGRDAWFVFTATNFPALPTAVADLQVRHFDDKSKSWSVSSRVTALPPPRPTAFVALNQRLAYLSFSIGSGSTVTESLTILDTSDLAKVKRLEFTQPDFGGELLGLAGVRGSPGDPNGLGGSLAVMVGVGCAGNGLSRSCTSLNLFPIFVGNEISTGVSTPISAAIGGNPAFTSANTTQRVLSAVVPLAPTQNVRLVEFDPRDPASNNSIQVPTRARWIGGVAYAECQDVALLTTVGQGQLYAVSPQGLTLSLDLGRSGQGLAYDPFTGRVFSPFNPHHAVFGDSNNDGSGGAGGVDGAGGGAGAGGGGVEPDAVSAFEPARSGSGVTIVPASGFNSPVDLAPNLIAARFPVPFTCR